MPGILSRIIFLDTYRKLVSRKTASYPFSHEPTDPHALRLLQVSVKSQTVIPREVREQLDLKPGDTLRYRVTDDGVLLDKAPANEADDPFATFSEWSNEADEKAYGALNERSCPALCRALTAVVVRPATSEGRGWPGKPGA